MRLVHMYHILGNVQVYQRLKMRIPHTASKERHAFRILSPAYFLPQSRIYHLAYKRWIIRDATPPSHLSGVPAGSNALTLSPFPATYSLPVMHISMVRRSGPSVREPP